MKSLLLVAGIAVGLSSCASVRAVRMADGTISIREEGRGTDLTRTETLIKGAAEGTLTPASALSVSTRAYLKIQPATPTPCEGYVDCSEPKWVEVHLATHRGGALLPLSANGRHRLRR